MVSLVFKELILVVFIY